MAKLSREKRETFRDDLELRLRRAKGERFQELVAALFTRIHGDNFVPVCPWGDKGDLSCDGYLIDPPTVIACYGPENGGANKKSGDIVSKVTSDLKGAMLKWPRMKKWMFVTNLVGGAVPGPVISALEHARSTTGISIGYFGQERFETELLNLEEEVIEDIIGPLHIRRDFIELQPEAVRRVVAEVSRAFSLDYLEEVPKVVPEHKLGMNRLGGCHASAIKRGLLGWSTVNQILSNDPVPLFGPQVSVTFKRHYECLRLQGFTPEEVLDHLYDFAIKGQLSPTTTDGAAAWAVLAYLFAACSIFEDKPWVDVP